MKSQLEALIVAKEHANNATIQTRKSIFVCWRTLIPLTSALRILLPSSFVFVGIEEGYEREKMRKSFAGYAEHFLLQCNLLFKGHLFQKPPKNKNHPLKLEESST